MDNINDICGDRKCFYGCAHVKLIDINKENYLIDLDLLTSELKGKFVQLITKSYSDSSFWQSCKIYVKSTKSVHFMVLK